MESGSKAPWASGKPPGSLWEASGKPLRSLGKPLGSLWEASGSLWKPPEVSESLWDSEIIDFHCTVSKI